MHPKPKEEDRCDHRARLKDAVAVADARTTVLYSLGTLAQTYAALAAFMRAAGALQSGRRALAHHVRPD